MKTQQFLRIITPTLILVVVSLLALVMGCTLSSPVTSTNTLTPLLTDTPRLPSPTLQPTATPVPPADTPPSTAIPTLESIPTDSPTLASTSTPLTRSQPLELVGHLDGTAGGVFALAGDYIYMASGKNGLRVIDISDPVVPLDVGFFHTPDAVSDVAVSGNYIFVSVVDQTLRVLDNSNPTELLEIGRYHAPDEILDVKVSDNHVYLATGDSGLRVVDISTPTAPKEISVYNVSSARTVTIVGNFAYLIADKLHLLDISNPTTPAEVNIFAKGGKKEITVEKQQAYATWNGYNIAGVDIVDISKLTAPTLLGTVGAFFPLYDAAIMDNYIYLFALDGLRMVDILDPTNPVTVGFYKMKTDGGNVIVADGYVYVTDYTNGLSVFKTMPVTIPEPTLTMELVDHRGGKVNNVFVQDNYAYVGFGPELAILDISAPHQPIRIGHIVLPAKYRSIVQDITVAGPYAYVLDQNNLWIVDVSNPVSLARVGNVSTWPTNLSSWTPHSNTSITVVGQYAYLTQESCSGRSGSGNLCHGKFKVMDVSDPTQPFEVSVFGTSGGRGGYNTGTREVQIIDTFAYVADSEEYGLRVFDVSDPTTPLEIGNSGGGAEDMVLRDGYAYVTNGYWGGFRILDVSDPTSLNHMSIYDTPGRTWNVALVDHYVYFAEDPPWNGGKPVSDYGLRILNISDPLSPTMTGLYTTSTHITDLTVKGHYAYLTTADDKLRILNVSDPVDPVEIGVYSSEFSTLDHLTRVNDELYLADDDQNRLHLIDTSTPLTPKIIGTMTMSSKPTELIAHNNYVYVLNQAGLWIIDISEPTTPIEASLYQTSNSISAIVADGYYIYLTSGSTLQVIDVSTPTSPIEVGQYDLPSEAKPYSLALVKNHLYIRYTHNANQGLLILNISNPTVPLEVKHLPALMGSNPIVRRDYAYIVSSTEGLRVLDISDPTNPIEVGVAGLGIFGIDWGNDPKGVVANDYAYLIDNQQLRIIDVSTPTAPIEVGYYPIPGYVQSVAVVDDYIYATTSGTGLFILSVVPDIGGPSPTNSPQPIRPPEPIPLLTPTPVILTTPTPAIEALNVDLVGHWDGYAGTVIVQDNYAYAGIDAKFTILDILDPAHPSLLGSLDLSCSPKDIIIADNYAYVVCWEEGLKIVNISNVRNPIEVSSFDTGNDDWAEEVSSFDTGNDKWVEAVIVAGNYAYLVTEFGLHILDITNPTTPSQVGGYHHPYHNNMVNITIKDNYAYLSDWGNGLQIIDISNPTAPFRVKANIRQKDIYDTSIVGETAYVAGSEGLHMLDISDPRHLIEKGFYKIAEGAHRVIVKDDYAYVSSRREKLYVLDISMPAAITEVGFYTPPGGSNPSGGDDIVYANDYIYVADGDGGLLILQYNTGATPAITTH
ncbi:LVIVD repeat-containing protein [Chloroflexota bacterium]